MKEVENKSSEEHRIYAEYVSGVLIFMTGG